MKYQRKTHQFKPFILQIKIWLVLSIVLLLSVIILSIVDNSSDAITCYVSETGGTKFINKSTYKVITNNVIEIKQRNLLDRLLIKPIETCQSPIYLLEVVVILGFIAYATFKIKKQNYFNINLSKFLFYLFWIMLLFYFLEHLRDYYTVTRIRAITASKFSSNTHSLFSERVLFAIIILWLHFVFKKGEKLQKENDLTV